VHHPLRAFFILERLPGHQRVQPDEVDSFLVQDNEVVVSCREEAPHLALPQLVIVKFVLDFEFLVMFFNHVDGVFVAVNCLKTEHDLEVTKVGLQLFGLNDFDVSVTDC